MPELPEVESFRRYFEATALGQKVVRLEINAPKIVQSPIAEVESALINHTLVSTDRIGKYLFVQTSANKTLMLHFGMTGELEYFRDIDLTPRFTRVLFWLENGFLAFTDPRKFGKLAVGNSIAEFQQAKKLSTDALTITLTEFAKNLGKRKMPIKSALLDQKVAAGVGNWIADEILFQAKIHPQTLVWQLTTEQIALMYQKMQAILRLAVQHEAYYRDFPRDYLIHSRGWTDEEPANCPNCDSKIPHIYISGRASYYCEQCQNLII
ncbi:MAG: DNA-formamidopyrimidine glycosylase [Microscillaceae bacterium]|jgi:formamidopyrimidine-DNA glycosylase|nr:DNA-formamidopyrimidine glycosylase [Microscillaceae bacterium]